MDEYHGPFSFIAYYVETCLAWLTVSFLVRIVPLVLNNSPMGIQEVARLVTLEVANPRTCIPRRLIKIFHYNAHEKIVRVELGINFLRKYRLMSASTLLITFHLLWINIILRQC